MPYMSRWGEPIRRALSAYMPGIDVPIIAVNAVETIVKTAEQHVNQVMAEEMAEKVCEGLHPGRAAHGLKCLSCYNAEHNFNEEIAIQAEIQSAKQRVPETDSDS